MRLFNEGRRQIDIASHLNVSRQLVSNTIKRFRETERNSDRPGKGRKRTARTTINRRKIRERVKRNPSWSTRKLGKAVGISHESARQILKSDLKLTPYKLRKAHLLTDAIKATRLGRCKALKRRFAAGRHRSILFSDEKLFTI